MKPLHHMSKIRISDEFDTSSTDFIRVATLEELKTARMLVAPRMPLTIGLSASPASDAVVNNPEVIGAYLGQ